MTASLAFQLLNALVLPWWAVWIAAPRSAWAARAASGAGIFLALAAVYAALLVTALTTGALSGLGFDAVRAGLATPFGFLAGWTHYLMLDLFAGAWIVRESGRLDLEPRPYLVFALLVAPVGLGAFLFRRALRLRSFGQIGGSDLA